jgi:exopolyphosphatase/guanosine-5'-triphosphate,3'-diphosphate pyrophosphatase
MANQVRARRGALGVLDLGSNTILLLVMAPDGAVVRDEARITRLSEGVFASGSLAAPARARSRAAIDELVALARASGVERLVAVGTEALRRASDGRAFLEALVAEGVVDAARLLSGDEEARVAVEATRRALAPGRPFAVVDVGGGSTEVARRERGSEAVTGTSLPLGSVRLTEAWLPRHPVPAADLARVRAEVARVAEPLAPLEPDGALVAVAGTATTLAALELALESYDAERVEGLELSRDTLTRWLERLAQISVAERKRLPGLEPGRADVIVAGLAVLEGVLARLSVPRFRVSGKGVRHGVALRILAGEMAF